MDSVASQTLEKARFFVNEARRANPSNSNAIANYLEAAIVFARSTTLHLQKQFAHTPGFEEWYQEQQRRLNNDRLSRFLLLQRNYLLKEGPAPVSQVIGISITDSVKFMTDIVDVRLMRSVPWYKTSPKTLFHDLINPLRQRVYNWRQKRAQKNLAKDRRDDSSGVVVRHDFYFADEEWKGTPALDLLDRYLATLEAIIKEAEGRFLSSNERAGTDST
jgi:hypothetical protein